MEKLLILSIRRFTNIWRTRWLQHLLLLCMLTQLCVDADVHLAFKLN